MTIFNALYFAGLSGALLFLPIWLEKARGLDGTHIGLILAAAGFGRMIVGPVMAGWADGQRDRHAAVKLLSLAALAAFGLLGIVQGFWLILAACLVGITAYWMIVGYVEAGLMRLCKGVLSYPVARGLGSAAFVVGSLSIGRGIDLFGAQSALWFILGICGALAIWSWVLTPEIDVNAAPDLPLRDRLRDGLALVRHPAFFMLIIGAGFVQASHAFYNAFGGLVWLNSGIDGSRVGLLYSVGVAVEVLFLVLAGTWSERFHPTALLLAGALGATFRWSFLAMQPDLAWLLPLQALHGLSFAATYLGTMRLIQMWFGVDRAPTAQMMYQSFAAAPEAALATLMSGPLYDWYGAGGYWGMTVLAAIGIILVWRLRTIPPPKLATA